MSATEKPGDDGRTRYVRLQAELVLEVSSPEDLRSAALAHIESDAFMPRRERVHAEAAAAGDPSEALGYLVDPADMVSTVPGVELVQASWSCAPTDHRPAAEDEDWTPEAERDLPDDSA